MAEKQGTVKRQRSFFQNILASLLTASAGLKNDKPDIKGSGIGSISFDDSSNPSHSFTKKEIRTLRARRQMYKRSRILSRNNAKK